MVFDVVMDKLLCELGEWCIVDFSDWDFGCMWCVGLLLMEVEMLGIFVVDLVNIDKLVLLCFCWMFDYVVCKFVGDYVNVDCVFDVVMLKMCCLFL